MDGVATCFFCVHPETWGRFDSPCLTSIFSKGLVQPPISFQWVSLRLLKTLKKWSYWPLLITATPLKTSSGRFTWKSHPKNEEKEQLLYYTNHQLLRVPNISGRGSLIFGRKDRNWTFIFMVLPLEWVWVEAGELKSIWLAACWTNLWRCKSTRMCICYVQWFMWLFSERAWHPVYHFVFTLVMCSFMYEFMVCQIKWCIYIQYLISLMTICMILLHGHACKYIT